MGHVLVLDLGTTYFKACVFDDAGELRALRRCPAPLTRSDATFREISVPAFREAVTKLVRALGEMQPGMLDEVEAVTFASQTNSFVLLDAAHEPLTPILLWNDRRAEGLPGLDKTLQRLAELRNRTGVPALSPGFMVAKLHWLRAHEPGAIAETTRLCLISDYLALWCTGRPASEAGAAGLTALLDIHRGAWMDEALDCARVNPAWLPEVVRAGTRLGPVSPAVCAAWSLPEGCLFVAGCLDQYAGAIGAGNVSPGAVSETTGTVLATVRCAAHGDAPPGTAVFVGPAFDQGLYYHMCFGDASAALLETFRNALPGAPAFSELDEAAAGTAPGATGPRLPWRTDGPELHRLCEAWARSRPRGEAVRAILEGVAFALQDQVATLCGAAWPDGIACAGGAAHSALWLQIKADVLNIPTAAAQCPEPTSLGAALLARHALTGARIPDLARRCARRGMAHAPDAARHAAYARLRAEDQ